MNNVLVCYRLAALMEFADIKGYKMSTISNKTLADSLDSCVDSKDPSINKVRVMLLLVIGNNGWLSNFHKMI